MGAEKSPPRHLFPHPIPLPKGEGIIFFVSTIPGRCPGLSSYAPVALKNFFGNATGGCHPRLFTFNPSGITSRRAACATRIWIPACAGMTSIITIVFFLPGLTPWAILIPRRWRSKFLWKRDRGLSSPAIHMQSLRDWLQARCLHHKDLGLRAGETPASQGSGITSRRDACITRIWDYEQASRLRYKDLGLRAGETPALQGSGSPLARG